MSSLFKIDSLIPTDVIRSNASKMPKPGVDPDPALAPAAAAAFPEVIALFGGGRSPDFYEGVLAMALVGCTRGLLAPHMPLSQWLAVAATVTADRLLSTPGNRHTNPGEPDNVNVRPAAGDPGDDPGRQAKEENPPGVQ